MIAPKIPTNEFQRQKAVEKYGLLDTLPEESFDSITRLISYICNVPIALITLLDNDRNFLKSHHGIPFNESPREISFCGHAINSEEPIMIVEDSRKDERFHDNPLVEEHGAIFYAGVPLENNDGFKLGTLCIYDNKPRKLDDGQISAMIDLSKQVMNLYEQKYNNIQLKKFHTRLQERNENLRKFASVVSHDLKSPLSNIVMLTELLKEENKGNLNQESEQYLNYLRTSSLSLRDYIDGLLQFYKSDRTIDKGKEEIDLKSFFENIKELSTAGSEVNFQYPETSKIIRVNKIALEQVFLNLVTNAVKYNSKDFIEITISFQETGSHYIFSVKDNGNGISENDKSKIFDLFTTLGKEDREGNIGSGIGLATVKKLITSMEGDIHIDSEIGIGSEFRFSVCKG
ncbi:GAF domain-containing sensor histidine kinase [Aquimarina sp. D1M17]|uniref:sensor histidine kinase n=1 Tax=Aquimarina acroporae TaxID=2937283 RepID=UPI0020C10A40|nr:GAF domain-containing sensor histidine kinase [Aquimarina acroporae]MCK8519938.1 GAF domain-containing sensor histidine kinase [Aquimarina acroporae]